MDQEDDEVLTSVQVTRGTLRRIGVLAVANGRSKTKQVKTMVYRDYEELRKSSLSSEIVPLMAVDKVI